MQSVKLWKLRFSLLLARKRKWNKERDELPCSNIMRVNNIWKYAKNIIWKFYRFWNLFCFLYCDTTKMRIQISNKTYHITVLTQTQATGMKLKFLGVSRKNISHDVITFILNKAFNISHNCKHFSHVISGIHYSQIIQFYCQQTKPNQNKTRAKVENLRKVDYYDI